MTGTSCKAAEMYWAEDEFYICIYYFEIIIFMENYVNLRIDFYLSFIYISQHTKSCYKCENS